MVYEKKGKIFPSLLSSMLLPKLNVYVVFSSRFNESLNSILIFFDIVV